MKRSKAVVASAGSVNSAPRVDPTTDNPAIPFSHPPHHPPSYPLPLPNVLHRLLFNPSFSSVLSLLLLSLELPFGVRIIRSVAYTEIDWVAYMQEVRGFLHGQLDYLQLRGDTGPLVYPAGFVWAYSGLYYLTGEGHDVRLAQYLFHALYLLTLYLVHRIYIEGLGVPPYVLVLLSLSKRVHSIFVLRLFNDGLAMCVLYGAVLLLIRRQWWPASLVFSLALSIKMNILLFAPAFLLVLLHSLPVPAVALQLLGMVGVQVGSGLPFLLSHPVSYLSKAFEFSRVFLYKWTVNLKVLPEELFLSRELALTLLAAHVAGVAWVVDRWSKGGVKGVIERGVAGLTAFVGGSAGQAGVVGGVAPASAVWLLFVTNFIGVVFARSLHYQFYVWYWHTLPLLLHWAWTPWPRQLGTGWYEWRQVVWKLGLLAAVELCWNTYPATWWSSALLIACHLTLLVGVLVGNGVDYTAYAAFARRPKVT